MEDTDAARAARAKSLRSRIARVIKGGKADEVGDGDKESDRDFVERRMREEAEAERRADAELDNPD